MTPRCSIVPPYMLEALVRSAGPHIANHAREALVDGRELRRARRARTLATAPGPEGASSTPDDGTGPNRTISDAAGSQTTPGATVRTEGASATGDAAADEAYDGLGATWELWSTAYGRDSLDDKGLPLLATVHYGRDYDNAFWDGTQMVFGDGDGTIFERFTRSVDVIGHELAHGVTEHTAGLLYQGQSGALNESISDVFGVLVKQRQLGQTAQAADWLVGAELLNPSVRGRALRDMQHPGTAYDDPRLGKDPQPAHMDGYVQTRDDNGGVHINSGIPNRAFVLAALAIGGKAWEGPGAIWNAVLTGDGIRADCDFATFAGLTVTAAGRAHGDGSAEQVAVRSAWEQVGVLEAAPTGGPDATGTQAPGLQTHGSQTPGGEAHGDVPDVGTQLLLRRTGGFAGQVRERQLALDELPDRDASDWRSLLAAPTLQRIADTTESARADGFCYSVRCQALDLDVTLAEPHLPEAIHSLFERTLAPGSREAAPGPLDAGS